MTISSQEQARRRRLVDAARHSSYLEGGQATPAARAIQDQFVRGEIDAAEMLRRGRALHGVGVKHG